MSKALKHHPVLSLSLKCPSPIYLWKSYPSFKPTSFLKLSLFFPVWSDFSLFWAPIAVSLHISQNIMTTESCDESLEIQGIVLWSFWSFMAPNLAPYTLMALSKDLIKNELPWEALRHSPNPATMRDPYSFQASTFPFPALSILPFSSSSASVLPCCCRSFHLPIKHCAIWEKLWCLVTTVTFRKMQIVMNRNHKRNRSGFILWKLKCKLGSKV